MDNVHGKSYFEWTEGNMIKPKNPVQSMKSHRSPVTAMCWSSHGRYLLCADKDNVVNLWTNEQVGRSTQHLKSNGAVKCIKFLPLIGNQIYLYCDESGGLSLQDFDSEKPLETVGMKPIEKFVTVEAQPASIHCLSEDNELLIYDLRSSGVKPSKFEKSSKITCFDVCQTRWELVAVGHQSGSVDLFDIRNYSKPFKILSNFETALAITKNKSGGLVKNVHFNKSGSELIMNDGSGITYLFDLNENDSDFLPVLYNVMRNEGLFGGADVIRHEEQPDEKDIREAIHHMLKLMRDSRYTSALNISYQTLRKRKITDGSETSKMRSLKHRCYMNRKWPGDRWAALKEIMEAHILNCSSDEIHRDLIKTLCICGQYRLALSNILAYETKFQLEKVKPVGDLQAQIEIVMKRKKQEFLDVKYVSSITDCTHRYVGLNDTFTHCLDVQYVGADEKLIATLTSDGQVILYDKKNRQVQGSIGCSENPLEITVANPVEPMLVSAYRDGILLPWRLDLENVGCTDNS